jgi:hypothetical protein
MVISWILPKFNGLSIRRIQIKELLITSLVLFSCNRCSKWPPCSRTHNPVQSELEASKRSSVPRVLYCTCQVFISTLEYLSSIDCAGIDLGFQISPQKKKTVREDSRKVSVQARKLELHIHDQSSVQDNFRTSTDALNNCNLVNNRRDETARGDTYWRTHLPMVHFKYGRKMWRHLRSLIRVS